MRLIKEGKARLLLPDSVKISRKAEAFYNPAMAVNRDFSVVFLQPELRGKRILDMLAGTGVRGIRYVLECGAEECWFIEKNPAAYKYLEKNIELNSIKGKAFLADARQLCLQWQEAGEQFFFVDLDPFGSPIHFLYFAGLALDRRRSLLAVTATDLGALFGQSRQATVRKYCAVNDKRLPWTEELGLRILLGAVAREMLRHELGIKPLGYHFWKHFVRVYVEVSTRLEKECIQYLGFACFEQGKVHFLPLKDLDSGKTGEQRYGVLWAGKLVSAEFINKLINEVINSSFNENFNYLSNAHHVLKYLQLLKEEAACQEQQPAAWAYSLPRLARRYKLSKTLALDKLVEALRQHGYAASRSPLYSMNSVRTDAPEYVIVELIKELIK
ncbi:MAG: hypothetical protein GXO42_02555 [bacterium]|nr:hypothetical protein [bacterium]